MSDIAHEKWGKYFSRIFEGFYAMEEMFPRCAYLFADEDQSLPHIL
jgi:hypothetical protein